VTDSAFEEVWVDLPDGQSLCALINGHLGWLMYLPEPGAVGSSSRNLAYHGDPAATIEYRLNNGQHDWYPASWALPGADVRLALAYFAEFRTRPSFIAWHDD
jgi:hypothetical protein